MKSSDTWFVYLHIIASCDYSIYNIIFYIILEHRPTSKGPYIISYTWISNLSSMYLDQNHDVQRVCLQLHIKCKDIAYLIKSETIDQIIQYKNEMKMSLTGLVHVTIKWDNNLLPRRSTEFKFNKNLFQTMIS